MAQAPARRDMLVIDGEYVPGTITIERDTVEIPPSLFPEPDPEWTYTDEAGHEHYYDGGYPTLERIVVDTWWCADCHEHHDDYAMVCRLCGERIQPGSRAPSPFPTVVPGTETWKVEVGRYYERGTEHTIEAGEFTGTAVVVDSSLSADGTGTAYMQGVTEMSETAPR